MLSNADALHLPLPDKSAQTVITSPPYWGLRDYNVQGQLGLEGSPEEYVANLVEFGREAWRVLRDDGVIFLNLGDSYANVGKWGGSSGGRHVADLHGQTGIGRGKRDYGGLKNKNLVGIPWRVALALQADGWILRNEIIWHDPSKMPESVTDRFTRAHEHVFLFAKQGQYYFDQGAVKVPKAAATKRDPRTNENGHRRERGYPGAADNGGTNLGGSSGYCNRRTVWRIANPGFPGAHEATFPPELAEIMVLAGCPPDGLVLDPFCGSGTVGQVCRMHGRRFIGLDLNFDYLIDFAMARAERRTPERAMNFGLFAQTETA